MQGKSISGRGSSKYKGPKSGMRFNMGRPGKWLVRSERKCVSGQQELEDRTRGVGMQAFCQRKESRFYCVMFMGSKHHELAIVENGGRATGAAGRPERRLLK